MDHPTRRQPARLDLSPRPEPEHRTVNRADLLAIVASVRRRWRLKQTLRGLAVVLAAAFATFILAAWALDQLRFSPGSILTFRILITLVVSAPDRSAKYQRKPRIATSATEMPTPA